MLLFAFFVNYYLIPQSGFDEFMPLTLIKPNKNSISNGNKNNIINEINLREKLFHIFFIASASPDVTPLKKSNIPKTSVSINPPILIKFSN